jgi:hypothetical protein
MAIALFRDRVAMVDQRSLEFFRTLLALGGYCTAAHAKQLGVAGSETRTRAQLRAWERAGLLRKIAAYPVVYQVTKSTTRLLGRDSSARRTHVLATIEARLVAVNFYIEASEWPAQFVLDHEHKVATFRDAGCPWAELPRRGGKPYLWEDFVLRLAEGRICVAIVDQPNPGAFSQLRQFARRFYPLLRYLQNELQLLIATGSRHRALLYDRLLRHGVLRKIGPVKLETRIRPYCLRAPMRTIPRLLYPTGNKTRNGIAWDGSDDRSEFAVCDTEFKP